MPYIMVGVPLMAIAILAFPFLEHRYLEPRLTLGWTTPLLLAADMTPLSHSITGVARRGVVWLVPYAAVYLAIQLFDALSSGPYLALVPDIVSQAQVRVRLVVCPSL
jgi:hypothetical protein